jgi:hypothetical protein
MSSGAAPSETDGRPARNGWGYGRGVARRADERNELQSGEVDGR